MALNPKKIFFVGLGGAGQRHLRIFQDLLGKNVEYSAYRSKNKTPLLNNDFTIAKGSVEEKYGLRLFPSLEAGLANKPDLIVISTPSSLHLEPALKAAAQGTHLFIEKPFSHNLEGLTEIEKLVKEKQIAFFISYQRRFHPLIQKVKKLLEERKLGKIIQAEFQVASYVPAWHPYEDFRELYACRKVLGGGVLLTEIHEIDLCTGFFGPPKKVLGTCGNYGPFPLDVEDTAQMLLQYSNFSVQLNLCFMQKQNRREFSIAGTDGYVKWNIDGHCLTYVDYKSNQKYEESLAKFNNDEMFVAQAKYFLEEFKASDLSYLNSSREALQIIETVRQSCKM